MNTKEFKNYRVFRILDYELWMNAEEFKEIKDYEFRIMNLLVTMNCG